MEVSDDQFKLPIAVADSVNELARLTGTTTNNIYSCISHAKKHGRNSKYIVVEIEEGEDMEYRKYNKEENRTYYYDKNGNEIKEGMILRHDDGAENEVVECGDGAGSIDLGFAATNPQFIERHPDWQIEYYPLSQFNLAEWEIVEKTEKGN